MTRAADNPPKCDTPTVDGCPRYTLATVDPAATVYVYGDHGRYLGPAPAEQVCGGWHVGITLDVQVRAMLHRRDPHPPG